MTMRLRVSGVQPDRLTRAQRYAALAAGLCAQIDRIITGGRQWQASRGGIRPSADHRRLHAKHVAQALGDTLEHRGFQLRR